MIGQSQNIPKKRTYKYNSKKILVIFQKSLYGLYNFLHISTILFNNIMTIFLCQSVILPFLMLILTIKFFYLCIFLSTTLLNITCPVFKCKSLAYFTLEIIHIIFNKNGNIHTRLSIFDSILLYLLFYFIIMILFLYDIRVKRSKLHSGLHDKVFDFGTRGI